MSETYWWIVLGYHPFDMGKDGFPRTGQVVKHYRQLKKDHNGKPYIQSELARVLHISDQAMRDIENRDLAMNIERRRFLCETLNIPPILLGIITQDEIKKLVEANQKVNNIDTIVSTPVRTGKKLLVDTKEYDNHLRYLLTTHKCSSAHVNKSDALIRLDTMYHELPHVCDIDQLQIKKLLCGYHGFLSELLRDEQAFNEAMVHIDKASQLAEYLQNAELIAVALDKKASVFYALGSTLDVVNRCTEAKEYEDSLSVSMNCVILLHLGCAMAKTPQTDKDGEDALAIIDRVGNIIRSNPYLPKPSIEGYHRDRGEVLIAIGKNQDAIDELRLVDTSHKYPRGQAFTDTLLARAYINKGDYGYGVSSLESALDTAIRINSKSTVASIIKTYRELQQSPYKDSPDVARLGYTLRPYLSVIPH